MADNDISLILGIDPTSISSIRRNISGGLSNIDAALSQRSLAIMSSQVSKAVTSQTAKINIDPNSAAKLENLRKTLLSLSSAERLVAAESAKSAQVIKQQTTATQEADKATQIFATRIGFTTARLAAYAIPAASIFGLVNAFKTAGKEAVAFDQQINKLSQILDGNSEKASKLSDDILKIATSYGQSGKELLKTTVTLAQAGQKFATPESLVRVGDALAKTKLAATFGDLSDTTEGLIAILNQFNLTANDTNSILDISNELAKKFAVESGDIFKAVKSGGGAFSLAGGDIKEFAATVTALRQTTRLSAEQIGTGLNVIAVKSLTPEAIRFTEQLTGGKIRNADGSLKSIGQRFIEIANATRNLNNEQLAPVLSKLTDNRQAKLFVPLIRDIQKGADGGSAFVKALNDADNAAGSLTRDASLGLQTMSAQLASVGAKFEELFSHIGQDENIKNLVKNFADLSKGLVDVLEVARPLLPIVLKLGAIKLGFSIFDRANASGFLTGAKRFIGGQNPTQTSSLPDSSSSVLLPNKDQISLDQKLVESKLQAASRDIVKQANDLIKGSRITSVSKSTIAPITDNTINNAFNAAKAQSNSGIFGLREPGHVFGPGNISDLEARGLLNTSRARQTIIGRSAFGSQTPLSGNPILGPGNISDSQFASFNANRANKQILSFVATNGGANPFEVAARRANLPNLGFGQGISRGNGLSGIPLSDIENPNFATQGFGLRAFNSEVGRIVPPRLNIANSNRIFGGSDNPTAFQANIGVRGLQLAGGVTPLDIREDQRQRAFRETSNALKDRFPDQFGKSNGLDQTPATKAQSIAREEAQNRFFLRNQQRFGAEADITNSLGSISKTSANINTLTPKIIATEKEIQILDNAMQKVSKKMEEGLISIEEGQKATQILSNDQRKLAETYELLNRELNGEITSIEILEKARAEAVLAYQKGAIAQLPPSATANVGTPFKIPDKLRQSLPLILGLVAAEAGQELSSFINSKKQSLTDPNGVLSGDFRLQAKTNRDLGVFSGAAGGAGTGALLGSFIPGVGTLIGAGAGAVIGGIRGGFSAASENENQIGIAAGSVGGFNRFNDGRLNLGSAKFQTQALSSVLENAASNIGGAGTAFFDRNSIGTGRTGLRGLALSANPLAGIGNFFGGTRDLRSNIGEFLQTEGGKQFQLNTRDQALTIAGSIAKGNRALSNTDIEGQTRQKLIGQLSSGLQQQGIGAKDALTQATALVSEALHPFAKDLQDAGEQGKKLSQSISDVTLSLSQLKPSLIEFAENFRDTTKELNRSNLSSQTRSGLSDQLSALSLGKSGNFQLPSGFGSLLAENLSTSIRGAGSNRGDITKALSANGGNFLNNKEIGVLSDVGGIQNFLERISTEGVKRFAGTALDEAQRQNAPEAANGIFSSLIQNSGVDVRTQEGAGALKDIQQRLVEAASKNPEVFNSDRDSFVKNFFKEIDLNGEFLGRANAKIEQFNIELSKSIAPVIRFREVQEKIIQNSNQRFGISVGQALRGPTVGATDVQRIGGLSSIIGGFSSGILSGQALGSATANLGNAQLDFARIQRTLGFTGDGKDGDLKNTLSDQNRQKLSQAEQTLITAQDKYNEVLNDSSNALQTFKSQIDLVNKELESIRGTQRDLSRLNSGDLNQAKTRFLQAQALFTPAISTLTKAKITSADQFGDNPQAVALARKQLSNISPELLNSTLSGAESFGGANFGNSGLNGANVSNIIRELAGQNIEGGFSPVAGTLGRQGDLQGIQKNDFSQINLLEATQVDSLKNIDQTALEILKQITPGGLSAQEDKRLQNLIQPANVPTTPVPQIQNGRFLPDSGQLSREQSAAKIAEFRLNDTAKDIKNFDSTSGTFFGKNQSESELKNVSAAMHRLSDAIGDAKKGKSEVKFDANVVISGLEDAAKDQRVKGPVIAIMQQFAKNLDGSDPTQADFAKKLNDAIKIIQSDTVKGKR